LCDRGTHRRRMCWASAAKPSYTELSSRRALETVHELVIVTGKAPTLWALTRVGRCTDLLTRTAHWFLPVSELDEDRFASPMTTAARAAPQVDACG
jgi:hypothetical protein